MERRDQSIPNAILDNINGIKKELTVIADRIDLRQAEYQIQADKFDRDMARFLIIKPKSSIEKGDGRNAGK